MKLKDKIRELRKKQKLTLEDLANLTASSKSYIWEIENKDTNPSAEKLSKIAEVLNTTTEYLINDDMEEQGESDENNAFFRKYSKADPKTKEKLQQIFAILENEQK